MLELVVLSPVIAALACAVLPGRPKVAEKIALAGAGLALAFLLLALRVHGLTGTFSEMNGLLYLDPLSTLVTLTTAVISFFVFIYSIGYMRTEVKAGAVEAGHLSKYYLLISLFLAATLLATLTSNLLVVWAAVEATTLASVFLISFYNRKESIEAAWKYFIICSLGITVALIGVLILGYGLLMAGQPFDFSWHVLLVHAGVMNPLFLKIAFAFVLVGYGTKAGLVPLHVWLPDAHSQAPTPVSAVLSAVLLNVALYAIFRVYSVAHADPATASFAAGLFVFFGMLSLALAALRLYFQDNIKRLLAYSSVENMGIIVLAVGLGGPLGAFAGLLHMVFHSIAKALAFFLSGAVSFAYDTKEIPQINGAMHAIPLTGTLLFVTLIGVAGSLPFGTFFSELALIGAALSAGQYAIAVLFVVLVAVAFGSLLLKSSSMVLGESPEGAGKHPVHNAMLFSIIILFIVAVYASLGAPSALIGLVNSAAALIGGVA